MGRVKGLQTTHCLKLEEAYSLVRTTPRRCRFILKRLLFTVSWTTGKLEICSDSGAFMLLKCLGLGRAVAFNLFQH